MILIPSHTFTMGDKSIIKARPEFPAHVQAFRIEDVPVTLELWESVRNWADGRGYRFQPGATGKGPQHPVVNVTWFNAAAWCNARSEMAGLDHSVFIIKSGEPFRDARTPPRGGSMPKLRVCLTSSGYRLPTETEWEAAARSGSTSRRFPWGDRICERNANYLGSPGNWPYDDGPHIGYHKLGGKDNPRTTAVRSFPPTPAGLFDVIGNVEEWVWDWYGRFPLAAYTGPTVGTNKIRRGGAWNTQADKCRIGARSAVAPAVKDISCGFRCVKT